MSTQWKVSKKYPNLPLKRVKIERLILLDYLPASLHCSSASSSAWECWNMKYIKHRSISVILSTIVTQCQLMRLFAVKLILSYGRTTPNKPSLGKHVNFGFRDYHFLPLVTIFWQFSMHIGIEPNFIFLKNCIWLNIFSLDLRYRHPNSATTILSRRACLLTTFNLTQKSCAYALHKFEFWYFEIIWVMTMQAIVLLASTTGFILAPTPVAQTACKRQRRHCFWLAIFCRRNMKSFIRDTEQLRTCNVPKNSWSMVSWHCV